MMANFISKSDLLRKTYEKRKSEKMRRVPVPVSDICAHCWYQSLCIFRAMNRNPPTSCCTYEYFSGIAGESPSLEEVVTFTCDTRCKSRREWVGDPCPHDEDYCTRHCPVSKFIMGTPASNIDDVPYEAYG